MNEIKRLWISHKDIMSLFSGSNSISWFFKPTCLMNDTIFTIILYIQKNVHNYFLKIRLIQSLSRILDCLAQALLWQHSFRIWALSDYQSVLGILEACLVPKALPTAYICLLSHSENLLVKITLCLWGTSLTATKPLCL